MSTLDEFRQFLYKKDNDLSAKFHGMLDVAIDEKDRMFFLTVLCGQKTFNLEDLISLKSRWNEFVAQQDGPLAKTTVVITGTRELLATTTTHQLYRP